MNKYSGLPSLMLFAVTLLGCGEQPATEPVGSTSGATATDPAGAPASTMGSGGIDHARDIKEFELKRSLSGVESLIEDLQAKGADISELEAQKKDLEQKLSALTGG